MKAQVLEYLLSFTIKWRLGELMHCYLSSYEGSGIRVIVIVFHTMEGGGIDTLLSAQVLE